MIIREKIMLFSLFAKNLFTVFPEKGNIESFNVNRKSV